MDITGRCLCGAVSYRCTETELAGHCYCIDCRRSSGTGHCSHMIVPQEGFELSGNLKFFDAPSDNGNTVSRGFCPECGSPVYSTNSGMPGKICIRASSLDNPEVFKPQMNVFVGRAPSWDTVDASLPSFDSMPEGNNKS